MKHFIFSNPSLRKALFLSLLLFFFLTLLLWLGAHARTALLENNARNAFSKGITTEQASLLTEGNMLATNKDMQQAVRNKDSYVVLTLINQLSMGTHMSVAVSDADGYIFSRTIASLGRGDNSFVIGAFGRALVRTGKTAYGIDRNGLDPSQLIISSARYITDGGQTLGALYTTEFMDNTYAVRFAQTYLPHGVEVLFYSRGYGIYGESITDPSLQKLIGSYLYPESDWIANGKSGTIIRFPNGKYYALINESFPGVEHSPGGAILLVPIYDLWLPVGILIALTVLAFNLFLILYHRRMLKKETIRYNHILAVVAFLIMLVVVIVTEVLLLPPAEVLRPTGHVLYNSVLKLTPPIQVFDLTYQQTVAVTLDTGPEAINAVGVVLGYDPHAIDITSVSDSGSLCTELVEKNIDTVKGEIHYTCGVLNPGFTGAGTVFTLTYRAHAPGIFSLKFLPETQVLANDGLGTNVLRLATDGSYTATSVSTSTQISLYSPTHPNSEQWYNSRVIDFSWGGSATSTYAYALDTIPVNQPSSVQVVTGQKTTVTAPADGIYYFHLAPVVNGKLLPALTYKVRIDTTAPSDITIRASDTNFVPGDVARLELSASDSGSGLQKNYYLAVNKGLFLPTHQSVYVPLTTPGINTLTVRAYDNAGNHSDSTVQLQVHGTFFQNLLTPFLSQ